MSFTFHTPKGAVSLTSLQIEWLRRDPDAPIISPVRTRDLAAIKLWLSRELKLQLDDIVVKANGIGIM